MIWNVPQNNTLVKYIINLNNGTNSRWHCRYPWVRFYSFILQFHLCWL